MKTKPNYWYRQSAVVPFRTVGKKTEILILTTRKKRRWIFPKGIVETGLSARESALKEVLEEAGVKGKLLTQGLGTYSYTKWGGRCNVKVYALEVDTILDVWEENFRERKWIEINEVEKYIRKAEVLEIVKNFEKYVRMNVY